MSSNNLDKTSSEKENESAPGDEFALVISNLSQLDSIDVDKAAGETPCIQKSDQFNVSIEQTQTNFDNPNHPNYPNQRDTNTPVKKESKFSPVTFSPLRTPRKRARKNNNRTPSKDIKDGNDSVDSSPSTTSKTQRRKVVNRKRSLEVDDKEESNGETKKKRLKNMEVTKLSDVIDLKDGDIDEVLEIKAEKVKMNAKNVKSLIHHVLTNAKVLNMFKDVLEVETEDSPKKTAGMVLDTEEYEPKMTRAKVKDFLERISVASPAKKPDGPSILDVNFNEEEEDDEYDPSKDEHADESDDETERESLMSSYLSDFGSPCPLTPSTPRPPTDNRFSNLSHSQEAGCLTPFDSQQNDTLNVSENQGEDRVALRTRSKLPLDSLSLTDLENKFVAPDITPDMYYSNNEDADWTQFLSTLWKPTDDVCTDDDGEANDPEFDYIAEAELQQEDEDHDEETQFKKNTKITKKELNLLLDELSEIFPDEVLPYHAVSGHLGTANIYDSRQANQQNDFQDQCFKTPLAPISKNTTDVDTASCSSTLVQSGESLGNEDAQLEGGSQFKHFSPESSAPIQSSVVNVTYNERELIRDQLRKHIQLLAQSFLLVPNATIEMSHLSGPSQLLVELDHMRQNSIAGENSVLNVCNLRPAIEIVQMPSIQAVDNLNKTEKRELLELQKRAIFNSAAFVYPSILLPMKTVKDIRPINFLPSEDNLIALGLEQFRNCMGCKGLGAAKLIKEHMVCGKSALTILYRFQRLQLQNMENNAVKYLHKHKKLPDDFPKATISQFYPVPPCQQPQHLLPAWCQGYDQEEEVESDAVAYNLGPMSTGNFSVESNSGWEDLSQPTQSSEVIHSAYKSGTRKPQSLPSTKIVVDSKAGQISLLSRPSYDSKPICETFNSYKENSHNGKSAMERNGIHSQNKVIGNKSPSTRSFSTPLTSASSPDILAKTMLSCGLGDNIDSLTPITQNPYNSHNSIHRGKKHLIKRNLESTFEAMGAPSTYTHNNTDHGKAIDILKRKSKIINDFTPLRRSTGCSSVVDLQEKEQNLLSKNEVKGGCKGQSIADSRTLTRQDDGKLKVRITPRQTASVLDFKCVSITPKNNSQLNLNRSHAKESETGKAGKSSKEITSAPQSVANSVSQLYDNTSHNILQVSEHQSTQDSMATSEHYDRDDYLSSCEDDLPSSSSAKLTTAERSQTDKALVSLQDQKSSGKVQDSLKENSFTQKYPQSQNERISQSSDTDRSQEGNDGPHIAQNCYLGTKDKRDLLPMDDCRESTCDTLINKEDVPSVSLTDKHSKEIHVASMSSSFPAEAHEISVGSKNNYTHQDDEHKTNVELKSQSPRSKTRLACNKVSRKDEKSLKTDVNILSFKVDSQKDGTSSERTVADSKLQSTGVKKKGSGRQSGSSETVAGLHCDGDISAQIVSQDEMDELMATCVFIRPSGEDGATIENTKDSKPTTMSAELDKIPFEEYFSSVKGCLESDHSRFQKLMSILTSTKIRYNNPNELLTDLTMMLHNHADLVDDFAGLLLLFQAIQCKYPLSNRSHHDLRKFLTGLKERCVGTAMTTEVTSVEKLLKWLCLSEEAKKYEDYVRQKILNLLLHVPGLIDGLYDYFVNSLPERSPELSGQTKRETNPNAVIKTMEETESIKILPEDKARCGVREISSNEKEPVHLSKLPQKAALNILSTKTGKQSLVHPKAIQKSFRKTEENEDPVFEENGPCGTREEYSSMSKMAVSEDKKSEIGGISSQKQFVKVTKTENVKETRKHSEEGMSSFRVSGKADAASTIPHTSPEMSSASKVSISDQNGSSFSQSDAKTTSQKSKFSVQPISQAQETLYSTANLGTDMLLAQSTKSSKAFTEDKVLDNLQHTCPSSIVLTSSHSKQVLACQKSSALSLHSVSPVISLSSSTGPTPSTGTSLGIRMPLSRPQNLSTMQGGFSPFYVTTPIRIPVLVCVKPQIFPNSNTSSNQDMANKSHENQLNFKRNISINKAETASKRRTKRKKTAKSPSPDEATVKRNDKESEDINPNSLEKRDTLIPSPIKKASTPKSSNSTRVDSGIDLSLHNKVKGIGIDIKKKKSMLGKTKRKTSKARSKSKVKKRKMLPNLINQAVLIENAQNLEDKPPEKCTPLTSCQSSSSTSMKSPRDPKTHFIPESIKPQEAHKAVGVNLQAVPTIEIIHSDLAVSDSVKTNFETGGNVLSHNDTEIISGTNNTDTENMRPPQQQKHIFSDASRLNFNPNSLLSLSDALSCLSPKKTIHKQSNEVTQGHNDTKSLWTFDESIDPQYLQRCAHLFTSPNKLNSDTISKFDLLAFLENSQFACKDLPTSSGFSRIVSQLHDSTGGTNVSEPLGFSKALREQGLLFPTSTQSVAVTHKDSCSEEPIISSDEVGKTQSNVGQMTESKIVMVNEERCVSDCCRHSQEVNLHDTKDVIKEPGVNEATETEWTEDLDAVIVKIINEKKGRLSLRNHTLKKLRKKLPNKSDKEIISRTELLLERLQALRPNCEKTCSG